MWQLDRDATNASSGSTASGFEYGGGTTCGDELAGTSKPPSKRQRCSRLYRLSTKFRSPRCHSTVTVYDAITHSPRESSLSSDALCRHALFLARRDSMGKQLARGFAAIAALVSHVGIVDAVTSAEKLDDAGRARRVLRIFGA